MRRRVAKKKRITNFLILLEINFITRDVFV